MSKKNPQTPEQRKEKQREATKRWAEKNREYLLQKKREDSKRWREDPENKEKKREQNQAYWERRGKFIERDRKPYSELTEEQKEKAREKSRLYAQEHAEWNRERTKRWALENPEKVKARYNKEERLEYNRQWRLANPEKHKAQQARQYKLRRSRRPAGGLCALCGQPETALARRDTGLIRALQQDHCHATGVLRGLLCLDCNRLLGAAKDSPALLIKAALYLEKYRESEVVQLNGYTHP